jgi:broad-specificity NMP kinase
MKRRILITGVSGVGKTSVGKYLKKIGYKSVDIENVEEMFRMVHKGTKNIFSDYDNANPEHVRNAEWICDIDRLKSLLKSQKSNFSFYSGIASNMDDALPLFDKVFVLRPGAKVLNERLKNREGADDIGNTQEGRDIVLGWKDWWEKEMKKKGAILINANGSLEKISEEILKELDII